MIRKSIQSHLRSEPQDWTRGGFAPLWCLVAFQAGFINSIGFSACKRFVSHVTGFGTQVGIALGEWRFGAALESALVPLFFIFGASLVGLWTTLRRVRGRRPRYDWGLYLIPSLLGLLWLEGERGGFGPFGEPMELSQDFLFLSFLAFICGVQNATFSGLTQGLVRTTHLTGLSTDLGLDLPLAFARPLKTFDRTQVRRRLRLRILLITSFFIGAIVSSLVDEHLKFRSLGVPIFSSLCAALFFRQPLLRR